MTSQANNTNVDELNSKINFLLNMTENYSLKALEGLSDLFSYN